MANFASAACREFRFRPFAVVEIGAYMEILSPSRSSQCSGRCDRAHTIDSRRKYGYEERNVEVNFNLH